MSVLCVHRKAQVQTANYDSMGSMANPRCMQGYGVDVLDDVGPAFRRVKLNFQILEDPNQSSYPSRSRRVERVELSPNRLSGNKWTMQPLACGAVDMAN